MLEASSISATLMRRAKQLELNLCPLMIQIRKITSQSLNLLLINLMLTLISRDMLRPKFISMLIKIDQMSFISRTSLFSQIKTLLKLLKNLKNKSKNKENNLKLLVVMWLCIKENQHGLMLYSKLLNKLMMLMSISKTIE